MKICLLIHGLGPPPPHIPEIEVPYWLTTDRFKQILELVGRAPNEVELTFDDANASDVRIALPALRAAGLTASFFVPTDRIGRAEYLSEADIRELRTAGMRIGSHGCAHIRWTQVSDDTIKKDVSRSINALSSILGEKIDTAAVPFGGCDQRVLRTLRRLGIRSVYTSFPGPCRKSAWIVKRDCLLAKMAEADISKLIMTNYTDIDVVVSFLRIARHAGLAALWPAT